MGRGGGWIVPKWAQCAPWFRPAQPERAVAPAFVRLGPKGGGGGVGWGWGWEGEGEWEWEWEVKWPGCRTVLYTPAPFALSLSKGCAGGAPWL